MDDKKFLSLSGLSSFLVKIKSLFATASQGEKADAAYTHSQSTHAPTNAERNTIVGIQKNGADITPNSSSRKVNITVPTKVSELTNDAGYKTTDTTYSNATTSASGLMSSSDKTKLNGIAAGANKYTHPAYTAKSSGLYKVTVDATGHVSATTAVTKSDITNLGIPASDTNTWIALKGATSSAAGTAGYVPAPSAGASNRYLRSDGIWAVPPDTNTTYNLGSFGITATSTELNYTDGVTSNIQTQLNGKASSEHTHTLSSLGITAKDPLAFEGNTITHCLKEDITPGYYGQSSGGNLSFGGSFNVPYFEVTQYGHISAIVNRTLKIPSYSNMKGATSSAAGAAGLVPAPASGYNTRYLRGDGTWQVPPNTTYGVATTSANGLLSAADKKKLDGIATGANKYTLPTASSSTLGGVKTTSTVTSTSGYTACPIISGVPYYKDTNTTYSLSSFGVTATAAELNKLDGCTATVTELNYVDGVTSNIQTQLNGKAASSHAHSYLPLSGGTLTGAVAINNARYIQVKNTSGTAYSVLGMSSNNNIIFGPNTGNYDTYLQGGNGVYIICDSDDSTAKATWLFFRETSSNKRAIFKPTANNGGYLGSASYKWNTVFCTTLSEGSDKKLKNHIKYLSEESHLRDFLNELKPAMYTLKDGEGHRTHMGLYAQDVSNTANHTIGDIAAVKAAVIQEIEKQNSETGEPEVERTEGYYTPDSDISDDQLSWTLSYTELIPTLIAGWQMHEQEISDLKQEINKITNNS